MKSSRWIDSYLDSLRLIGDPLADEALRRILHENKAGAIGALFKTMDVNDEIGPAHLFPTVADFFEATKSLPTDVDLDRLHRGEEVFEQHAFEGAVALLAKSLPEGYQAPNLSIILNISGDLRTKTYRRLLATLQTVVNVSTCHGFQQGGRAVITAQKLRLLHAAIRHLTLKYRPDFSSRFGLPVNQEDMLGTVLGFSLLVIEGWRAMEVGLTTEEEEDFLYLWLVFARMMGVHPPEEPASLAYIPEGVEDATLFYRAYERRHYVAAAENPDGVELARANLKMLRSKIPWFLRLVGFGFLPRVCLWELMGAQPCARLNISPAYGHPLIKWVLFNFHKLLSPFESRGHSAYERAGMVFFQDLIDREYGGAVTFTVPTSLNQLQSMVHSTKTVQS